MTKITLPQVCTEGWEKMTPAEKGRHCAICDKEVIDFTNFSRMEMEEILVDHFIARKNVCGHFLPSQLDKPKDQTFLFSLNYLSDRLQQFILAFAFAFIIGGFTGCTVTEQSINISISDDVATHLRGLQNDCRNFGYDGVPEVYTPLTLKDTTISLEFETGSFELTKDQKKIIYDIFTQTKKLEDYKLNYSIEIIGHTDNVGSFIKNQELSEKRAKQVARSLQKIKITDVRGVGYQFPISDNETPEGRARNRRVEVIIDIEKTIKE